MNAGVRWKLSVMMFLEFFIWGVWFPLSFGYLADIGFTPLQQSLILNAFAVASFTAMFFSTQFADRNFAAEKFLAFSQLVGGACILALGFTREFWPFFTLMLVHALFYVPTFSITNSIAFANLSDAKKDFGLVRLWGTIGWIAASWPFIFILVDWKKVDESHPATWIDWLGTALGTPKTGDARLDGVSYTFVAAGIASLLLAAFSLTLPHTPPKPAAKGGESLAWLEAMKLLKLPFLLVLFIVTFFDAAVHQCYFNWTDRYLRSVGIPGNWVMPVMSIGQIAEIGTMALLGFVLKNLGWKTTMIIGVLGHAVRFAVFAFFPEAAPAVLINVVHGICYAFFFATVYIFVDEFFPKDARSSAQGLFNFLIFGFGPFVGNFVWPYLGVLAAVGVPHEKSGSAIVFDKAERCVMISGKAPADAKFVLALGDPKTDPAARAVDVKANDKGEWTSGEQYLGAFAATKVTASVDAPNAVISEVTKLDYCRLFLYPAGTALAAALLLLLFFHPPATNDPKVVNAPPH